MKRKRVFALLLSAVAAFSVVGCGNITTKNTSKEETTVYMPSPSEGAKYTVTKTNDNWILIENEDGATLGLSGTSGVEIIEDDGYAFKDLNQNGELDVYEDWRNDTETRTADLVQQMEGEEKAAILAHGGWGDLTTEPLATDDDSYTYLMAGGRGGVTRSISAGGEEHAKWTNAIQEVAESSYYGIPAMISTDPINVSGAVDTTALGSTMDPELAAELGNLTAKEYRAVGVTALLGPQVDISSPVMYRSGGTYGEDPQLTLDIATAYVNAMQSTYDEDGTDLGWGEESVYCFTKHFAGAGATEGGRDDHLYEGRYAVFPGDNYEAHLITYLDGVLNLPGLTGSSGLMTEYAVNVDENGNPYSEEEYAGAFNDFQYELLDAYGYDGLTITDWGVFGDFGEGVYGYWSNGVWGTEDLTPAERVAIVWERGGNLLGGYGEMDVVKEAYQVLVSNNGEEKADEIISVAASDYITTMMNLKMFENPYNDSTYAASLFDEHASSDVGLDSQRESVVMIKNDGTINGEVSTEKQTVYVPYTYSTNDSVSFFNGVTKGTPSWDPGMDLDILGQYFNIVTDTVKDPSGENDAEGNATYTEDDIIRASADKIASCDFILVGMKGAYTSSYSNHTTGVFDQSEPEDTELEFYPVSLQYEQYTASTARDTSIGGVTSEDGSKENRSYKGNSTEGNDKNYGSLVALQYASSVAGDIPVIASVSMERGMVWSEVEPLADVILVNYSSLGAYKQYDQVVAEIIQGKTEPNGLLIFQQPASMEAVEAQVDDMPRDMECYVDSNGNTYDFAFGLNWSGTISDERVEKYSKEPLTSVQNFDFPSFKENYPLQ
ncbi:MAG: hypothetical protein K6E64_04365 [Lachnospiraceae bacterium]|nr:hypothetical protein [Lachnospiraceae bacterium]